MAVFYTLAAIFMFSMWTPIAAFVVQNISIWEFIFWAELSGFLIAWVLLRLMVLKTPAKYKGLNDLDKSEKLTFAISGFCRVVAMGCLFSSFSYVSIATAISVYDFWPILAIFLTPFILSKGMGGITVKKVVFSMVATGGLLLLMIPEGQALWASNELTEKERWVVLFLPLIAGLFQAISLIVRDKLIKKIEVQGQPFMSIFVVDINFGFFCLVFGALALLGYSQIEGFEFGNYSIPVICAILFFSAVVSVLGRMSLSLAVSFTTDNIFALWFFLPILTLLWLWLFGMASITSTLVLGAAMITVANLLVSTNADEGMAYPAALISLLLTSVYCFYFEGFAIEDYFEGVATPLIFYVLIVAFLMDRLINRDKEEESLVVELIRHVETNGPRNKVKKRELVEQVSSFVQTNSITELDEQYQDLRNAGHKCLQGVMEKLDMLVLSRIRGANFGEMLVLSMVGILVVLTAVVFRPPGVFGSCFSIVLSSSVCFIYFTVLDLIRLRKRFYLEMDDTGYFKLSKNVMNITRLDLFTSIALILVIIAGMIGVMWFKM